jgi:hypothetical protein
MADDLDPNELEHLRRSIAMLPPGRPALEREQATRLIGELQRLQRSDRRYVDLIGQLRALLDGLPGAGC